MPYIKHPIHIHLHDFMRHIHECSYRLHMPITFSVIKSAKGNHSPSRNEWTPYDSIPTDREKRWKRTELERKIRWCRTQQHMPRIFLLRTIAEFVSYPSRVFVCNFSIRARRNSAIHRNILNSSKSSRNSLTDKKHTYTQQLFHMVSSATHST